MTAQLVFPDNTDEFRLQQAQLLERKRQAQALIDQAMTSNGNSGMAGQVYMVGNQYGNLAKNLGGSIQSALADRDMRNLQQQQQQAQSAFEDQFNTADTTQGRKVALAQAQGQGLRHDVQKAFLAQEMRDAASELARREKREDSAIEKQAQREFLANQGELNRQARQDDIRLRAKTPNVNVHMPAAPRDRIQVITDADGQQYRVNLDTGEKTPLGLSKPPNAANAKQAAATAAEAKDNQTSLDYLAEAKKLLPKATGSGAGSLRDTIMGAAGMSTEGAKNAAQLKVISGYLTSKVPRMQGPQSDKDVAMYKEMAGNIGNEKLPMETRMAAADFMIKMHQKYAGQQQQSDSLSPAEQAELDQLRAKHGRK